MIINQKLHLFYFTVCLNCIQFVGCTKLNKQILKNCTFNKNSFINCHTIIQRYSNTLPIKVKCQNRHGKLILPLGGLLGWLRQYCTFKSSKLKPFCNQVGSNILNYILIFIFL